MNEFFRKFARTTSEIVGSPFAFMAGLLLILLWLVSGPIFHFSDTWQLVINTSTTVVTFLMVFIIQSSQNRDAKALHLKLDELIRAVDHARNHLVDLENRPDEELAALQSEFEEIVQKSLDEIQGASTDTADTEEVREELPQRGPAAGGDVTPSNQQPDSQ